MSVASLCPGLSNRNEPAPLLRSGEARISTVVLKGLMVVEYAREKQQSKSGLNKNRE